MHDRILIQNGSVLLGDSFTPADVIVEEGLVSGIIPRQPGRRPPSAGHPDGSQAIDAQGLRILPGFIDIHTHGACGVDFNRANETDIAKTMRFFSQCGVTSCLPTVMTDSSRTMECQLSRLSDPQVLGSCPQIIGVHLEGPFLNAGYRGAMPEKFLKPCDLKLFDALQAAARGTIALVTLSPELPGAVEMISVLAANGVRVSIGHSGASYEESMHAIEAGAAGATHAMNAMKLLHMHDPAILTAVLESDIYAEMICDGYHLHPPIVRLLLKVKGIDRMVAVTDSIMAAGYPDGEYTLGGNDVVVEAGDARLRSNGLRAGSTLTMIQAVRNIHAFTGLPLGKISRLVSENPAKMLGIFEQTGSIARGKKADLVAVSAGMEVAFTMAKGKTVFVNPELNTPR